MTLQELLQYIHTIPLPEELESEFESIKNELSEILNKNNDFDINYYKNHTGRELFRKLHTFGLDHLIPDDFDSGYRPLSIDGVSYITVGPTIENKYSFDENDFRYHARAWVGSNPIIISTTGIIEAPAKPKQFYMDLMTNFSEEAVEEIKKKYKGEFLGIILVS